VLPSLPLAAARVQRVHRRWGWVLAVVAIVGWARTVASTGRWPAGDGPHVLGVALRLAQLLRDGSLAEFSWCFPSLLAPHPPGAYAPAVFSYALLGEGRHVHLAAGGLLLFLCWDGLRRLGNSPLVGHLGLLWLMAGGLSWQQAEGYGIDLVAAAFVVQSLSWLAASEALRRRRAALLWGAWMGAAFLAKYTAPMFLIGPCLVAGLWVVWGGRWRQLGIAVVGWAVVALPWYLRRGAEVFDYATTSNTATAELSGNTALVSGPWTAPENLGWYPAVLLDQVGPWGLAALAAGLLLPAARRSPRGARIIVVLGVIGGWLILAQQIQRQARYLLPALPLLALLPAVVRGRLLLAPIAAVGCWGALQLYDDGGSFPPSRQLELELESAGAAWPFPPEPFRPTSESPQRWNLGAGVATLAQHVPEGTQTVGFLASDPGGPGPGLTLFSMAQGGHRWHLASVAFLDQGPGGGPAGADLPMRNGAAVFIAPFAIGTWPSRDFDVVMSILEERDTRRKRWLQDAGFEEIGRFETWPGWEGRVHRIPR
jgi:hypothetical protein